MTKTATKVTIKILVYLQKIQLLSIQSYCLNKLDTAKILNEALLVYYFINLN